MHVCRGDKIILRTDMRRGEHFYYDATHTIMFPDPIRLLCGQVVTVSEVNYTYPTLFRIKEDPDLFWIHMNAIECYADDSKYADVSQDDLIALIGG